MMSVDDIGMERYVKKQKTRKVEFYKKWIVKTAISCDFVCGLIAAAAVKINKMVNCEFPC